MKRKDEEDEEKHLRKTQYETDSKLMHKCLFGFFFQTEPEKLYIQPWAFTLK